MGIYTRQIPSGDGISHLIGEETDLYIHRITFIQRYLDIDCGFTFWAVVFTKKK